MKREDLKKLELSDEAIDAIMALHGKDIEAQKNALTTGGLNDFIQSFTHNFGHSQIFTGSLHPHLG